MTRTVTLAEALTLTTGMALVEDFSRVHELVEWMAGEPTWTHQIPRVGREIEAWLKWRYPELDVDVSGVNGENWREFLAAQEERFGKTWELERMPGDDHTHRCPIEEGTELFGEPPIVIVP